MAEEGALRVVRVLELERKAVEMVVFIQRTQGKRLVQVTQAAAVVGRVQILPLPEQMAVQA